MNDLLKAIQAIEPDACGTSTFSASRNLPDTIDEARAKVVDKLNLNIEFIRKGKNAATSKKPDLVYKHNASNGTYCIGAKYGNRWLAGITAGGDKFVKRVSEANLVKALELVREISADGSISLVNSVNPYRIQGQKTASFEIIDELGFAPDYHALPVGNAGSTPFQGHVLVDLDRTLAVHGLPEGSDHATEQGLPRGHRENAAGPLHGLAFLDLEVIAEDRDTDRVFLEVEGQAE